MATIDDSGDVFPEVYQLATTDPGLGGPPDDATNAGTLNRPIRHLAQRTRWLKTRLDTYLAGAGALASTAAAGIVQLVDSVTSTATNRAATPNSVKLANDNANTRVPLTRSVQGGGLVTGGGDLTTNRTLTVTAASGAQAIAGTADNVALTPSSLKAALDQRMAAIAFPESVPPSRQVFGGGLATGGGTLSADRMITVPKATEAQALEGTADTVAMTPKTVKAALEQLITALPVLGVGQAWTDVSALRVGGAPYANDTGRPIMVQIRANNSSGGIPVQVSANGSTWVTVGHLSQNEYEYLSFVVPAGHYYRIATPITALGLWVELR